MDDQVRVCVSNGVQHVQEQANARFRPQAAPVTVTIDRFTVHVFQHEIRLAERRDTGINQPGDVGMSETGQDAAFPPEPFSARPADQGGIQKFDGGPAFESAVTSARQPHGAHSAVANWRDQGIRSDDLACQGDVE